MLTLFTYEYNELLRNLDPFTESNRNQDFHRCAKRMGSDLGTRLVYHLLPVDFIYLKLSLHSVSFNPDALLLSSFWHFQAFEYVI